MNTHKAFNLMLAFVFVYSFLGISAPVSAQEPILNPLIGATVGATGDHVSGEEWPLGAQIIITIDDPTTPQSPDFKIGLTVSNTRPGQVGGSFDLRPTMDALQPGFTISVSDGITTKSLIVTNPNGAIDVVNDRVTGTTDPNREVSVLANNIMIQTRSDDAGYWSADFSGKTELQSDSSVEIRFFDNDGDFTSHTKHLPFPIFPLVRTRATYMQRTGQPILCFT